MSKLFSRKTKGDAIFDVANATIMLLICFITLYPVWYVLVNSFNDGQDALRGGIYWWPRVFTVNNYYSVFHNKEIYTAFGITIGRTLLATTIHIFFTAMFAYGMTKKELVGRRFFMLMGVVTLFFNGGLIPNFILMRNLHLIDTFWVFIFPAMFNFYEVLIFMAFFRELPASLEEAASIDGANDFQIFLKIIIPLSGPILATFAVFNGVYHWNDYFMGVIYINSDSLRPVQTFLYKLISETSGAQMLQSMPAGVNSFKAVTAESIKLATMVVTTFPIICVYPFLQKYFVKGMLIGSVKG